VKRGRGRGERSGGEKGLDLKYQGGTLKKKGGEKQLFAGEGNSFGKLIEQKKKHLVLEENLLDGSFCLLGKVIKLKKHPEEKGTILKKD